MLQPSKPSQAGGTRQPGWPKLASPTPAASQEIHLGLLPFGLVSLAFMMVGLARLVNRPAGAFNLTHVGLLLVWAAIFVGLGHGWLVGFHRPTFAYAGFALTFPLIFSNVIVPALARAGILNLAMQSPAPVWAWLPILVVVILVPLSTRSLQALVWPLVQIWRDWASLSFLLFSGVLAGEATIILDEIQAPLDLIYPLIFLVVFPVGALAYLRSRGGLIGAAALAAGLAALVIASFTVDMFRFGAEAVIAANGPLRLLVLTSLYFGLMLLPGIVGLLQRSVKKSRLPDRM